MMKALEISFNGRHVATVGVGHVVSITHSILEIHGGILNHIVRGFDGATDETLDWDVPQPRVGDEITVKVVETDSLSPPSRRWPRPTSP